MLLQIKGGKNMNWEKRQKFSIRKFSIGAASVMIGQFYLGTVANAPSVSADERTSAGVGDSKPASGI